jgi:hypothetical protein
MDFQMLELATQSWLRRVQHLRRTTETFRDHHRAKNLDLPEIKHYAPRMPDSISDTQLISISRPAATDQRES